MPYVYDISEGNVPNHEAWMKIGYTPAMTTTESDIWSKGGKYIFPTTASKIAVASSNAGDTLAGTGAQKVIVYYLDDNYNSASEVISTSGSTLAISSASNIFRINGFRVTQVGTTGSPLGNLSLTDPSGTTTYSYITVGYTRARNSAYTVPAGKNLYVVSATFSFGYSANQTHFARLYTRATQNDGVRVPGIFYPYTEVVCANSSQFVEFILPTKTVEKVDIKVSGISTFTGTSTIALRGWLENM